MYSGQRDFFFFFFTNKGVQAPVYLNIDFLISFYVTQTANLKANIGIFVIFFILSIEYLKSTTIQQWQRLQSNNPILFKQLRTTLHFQPLIEVYNFANFFKYVGILFLIIHQFLQQINTLSLLDILQFKLLEEEISYKRKESKAAFFAQILSLRPGEEYFHMILFDC